MSYDIITIELEVQVHFGYTKDDDKFIISSQCQTMAPDTVQAWAEEQAKDEVMRWEYHRI